MSIYKNKHYFYRFKINIKLIRELILKIQKDIYFFTKEYDIPQACKYQRKLLGLKKEILLYILSLLINRIKKKIYQHFIVGNFLV